MFLFLVNPSLCIYIYILISFMIVLYKNDAYSMRQYNRVKYVRTRKNLSFNTALKKESVRYIKNLYIRDDCSRNR